VSNVEETVVDREPAGLAGKVVVVTGGVQGLGEATARLAASRGAAGVAIVGRDRAKGDAAVAALADLGTEPLFVAADLSEPDVGERVMSEVDARFGVVHGLVNAAAEGTRGGVWDTTSELFDRLMAVNVRAPLLLLQSAARVMKREGVAGSIVNIGSMTGYGGQVYLFPYAITKGALHTLTKNAAYSLMWDHIRVNLVNLGWMDTPNEHIVQREVHGGGQDWLEKAEAEQPFGRLIKPGEAARTICFLLSDESGMMTGACIDFDQSVKGAGDTPKPGREEVWP
jgi:NAD(P)-dependent dehydrogenase (short-subunit alcohol dehydrogenase family)